MKQGRLHSMRWAWLHTKTRDVKRQGGFSVVEAMLSVTIFSLIIGAVAGAIVYGRGSVYSASAHNRANMLAEEGLDATRNIAQSSYSNLADGIYGLAQSCQSGGADWYDAGYLYRTSITLDHTKVSGGADLTDFPVLISTTQADLRTVANGGNLQNSNGYDMVFTASDGTTVLNFETETYDAATGQLIAWVKVPTLSASADTVLYLYYDNSSISSFQGNVNGTWNSNYAGVFHLPDGATLSTNDSTSNANNGTNHSATATTGQIDGGAGFSGSSQYINTTATAMPAVNGNMTISGWFYVPSAAGFANRDIATLYGSGVADQLRVNGSGNLQVSEWGGTIAVTGTHSISTDAWHYAVFTYNGTTATLYLDGQLDNSATATLQTGSTTALYIGTYSSGEYWNGSLDEIRVSNAVQTAGWVGTTYANQNSPSSFAAFGNAESGAACQSGGADWYDAGYLYRTSITLDHTKVSGGADLTDFPVLISTTQADLRTVANGGNLQNSNGYDMVFTASDGTTVLNFETETYDAATGQLIAWVKVPTLSASADTVLYLYYDNSSISSFQGNVNGTWSASYGAVYHLDEVATGAAGEYKDSTSNANDGQGGAGSTSKLPTNVAGAIGTSQSFDGSQTIYMSSMTGVPALDSTAQTLSWWYKVSANPTSTESIISLINSANSAANQAEFRGSVLGVGQWGGAMTVTSAPLAANSWHYVTWVHSGTTNYLYFDGTQVATSTTALQTGTVSQLILSGYNTTPSEGFIGQLDEVNVANAARTAGWVGTAYDNQSSPSSFATFGSPEAGAASAGGYWIFSGTSDKTDMFTRKVVVSSAGTNRKSVDCTVSWPQAGGIAGGSITLSTLLTNWSGDLPPQPGWWDRAVIAGSADASGTSNGVKVATVGNYAYTVQSASSSNFVVTDISNTASPTITATISISGTPTNITVSGNYAYVTTSTRANSLDIINISNPSAPQQVGTLSLSRVGANGVYVNGNYAYLVRPLNTQSNADEFVIVNISNPASPSVVGSYNANIALNEVYVSGNYAYVAAAASSPSVYVFRITTPTSPSLAAQYRITSSGTPLTITGFGSTLLVGVNAQMYALDASSAPTLSQIGSFSAAGTINDIDTDGTDYAFLGTSSSSSEFQVVTIKNLSLMAVASAVDVPGTSYVYGVAYNASFDVVVGASSSNTQEVIVFSGS